MAQQGTPNPTLLNAIHDPNNPLHQQLVAYHNKIVNKIHTAQKRMRDSLYKTKDMAHMTVANLVNLQGVYEAEVRDVMVLLAEQYALMRPYLTYLK